MRPTIQLTLLSLALILLNACANRTVTRISPDQQTDLSGRWNDTDSRLVANEMIKQCLSHNWLSEFNQKNGRKPVVIVGLVTNKTAEQIEPEVFIKDLEREYINSATVRVVTNSVFREKLRQERADQQEFASPETAKKWGRELGADFMMFGTMNSINDEFKAKKTIFYQINLELTNLETNELVWIGEKEIKKFIQN
jgi:penicillin-binding protein activator